MKFLLPMLALSAAVSSVVACTPRESVLDRPPGTYERSGSSTDSSGTKTEHKESASVGYDANGNKEAVIKNKTTVDPPGLFNKKTTESTEVVKQPPY